MKRTHFVLIVAGISSLLLAHPGQAQREAAPDENQTDFLCAPRLQLRMPQRCGTHGPAAQVREQVLSGMASPLPTRGFDPTYQIQPFQYVRVKEGVGVDIYTTPQDATRRTGQSVNIQPGFVFLSYDEQLEQQGTPVFSTPRGFVHGADLLPVAALNFHGLQFSRSPTHDFGWINTAGACTVRDPENASAGFVRCYERFQRVSIYDSRQIGNVIYRQIGPQEWINWWYVAAVQIDPTPPPLVTGTRWISINLDEQTLTAYDEGELVFATMISTGRSGFWTRPGTFQVREKFARDTMTGGSVRDSDYYFLQDVPYVLYFDEARALHGTYWHAVFGRPTSRGCVNLAIPDAHWIFDFAEVGTFVHVFDPTGRTPTDPALYSAGGA